MYRRRLETETDAYPTKPRERGESTTLALYVALRADEPLAHVVEGIDAIHFRRGNRGVERMVRGAGSS